VVEYSGVRIAARFCPLAFRINPWNTTHMPRVKMRSNANVERQLSNLTIGRSWPEPSFAKGGSKVTLACSATVTKVSFQVQSRTHTIGQERPLGSGCLRSV